MCFKLSTATKSTDLHKEIKISHIHNLPSANWTYLAGNPCRKRKFWPDHLRIRPSFRPQTIRWMSNMRWISSPNSYRNIEICSKHSWKKGPFTHIDFGRRSNIKTQTNQIWADFRLSETEEKRWSRCCQQRTECRNNASHQKTRCPYQRHCSLPFCSHCSPCQKTTDVSCKSQRISAQPILMHTNEDIQTTTYFSAMRTRPFAKIKEGEEAPTIGLPIRFFALDKL